MRTKLMILGLIAATAAFPQGRGGGGGSRGGGRGDAQIPMSFTKNKLEVISDMLQLSKEQKKDVKALMDEAQKEAAPLKEQLAKSHARVAAAIQGGKQEEVDEAIAGSSQVDAKMTAVEMKAFAGIYKLLDPDQRTKSRGLFVMMPGIFRPKNWVDTE
jgi:hypothetical protein